MIVTNSKLNPHDAEFILKITNNSNDTLNRLHLASKNDLAEIIDSVTILRERGELSLSSLEPHLMLGNLHPNESAKLVFKLSDNFCDISTDLSTNIKILGGL